MPSSDWYIIIAVCLFLLVGPTCLEILEYWWLKNRRFRLDIKEGERLPKKWFSWGYYHRWNDPQPNHKYVLLRLPSYVFQTDWYSDRFCWFQRAILYRKRLGLVDSSDGFRIVELRLDD